ncbi:MAG: hypothetical protein EOO56_03945 [Hymenobacter sp.]|nr:MAG: hypothetical protein EOO56_03945 [Hymenobacter sp.]
MRSFFQSATTRWAAPVAALGLLAACSSSQTTTDTATTAKADSIGLAKPDSAATASAVPMPVKPSGTKPAWAPGIHPEMQAVIEQLEALSGGPNAKPLSQMTPQEARKATTIASPPTSGRWRTRPISKATPSALPWPVRAPAVALPAP